MGLIKTYEELTALLKEGSYQSPSSLLDTEKINLIVKTLTSSATPKGEAAVEAFQSFVFESMVYVMTRKDMFEKDRKKIVYALCNLNSLPWTIHTKDTVSEQSFIPKAMEFLVDMLFSRDKNVITLGIEMLIPGK
jgi:iron uptake system EfeUOB component EfeO/EfeM